MVFVSSDRSEDQQMQYMREAHGEAVVVLVLVMMSPWPGDWLAVPWGDPLVEALSSRFGVRGIPALKVRPHHHLL